MDFAVRPKRVVIALAAFWALLVLVYGVTQYCHIRLHMPDTRQVVKFFDLDGKANIPQTFQAICLLAIACLLFSIARHARGQGDPLAIYWKSLAWIFVYLTFDGICAIHNQLHAFTAKNQQEQRQQGIFYFSWTLVYGAFLLPVGLLYLRFLFRLPRTLATEIFVAGVVFVSGAMGLEMVYGWFRSHYGQVRASTVITLITIEESMEMLGELLMLHALLSHMAQNSIRAGLSVMKDAPQPIISAAACKPVAQPVLEDDNLHAALHH